MSNDDQAFKLAREYLSLDRTLISGDEISIICRALVAARGIASSETQTQIVQVLPLAPQPPTITTSTSDKLSTPPAETRDAIIEECADVCDSLYDASEEAEKYHLPRQAWEDALDFAAQCIRALKGQPNTAPQAESPKGTGSAVVGHTPAVAAPDTNDKSGSEIAAHAGLTEQVNLPPDVRQRVGAAIASELRQNWQSDDDVIDSFGRAAAVAYNEGVIHERMRAAATANSATRAQFTPTHRHADGGLYRFVAAAKYKPLTLDWSDAIIYEADDGKLYVTTPARWNDRFSALADRGSDEKT